MMGKRTASRRALFAALAGVAALVAHPAHAGVADKLRDGLFKHRGSEPTVPPLACYVSEEGRVFTLDRTQRVPTLKFDDSPEVFALQASMAPRGDVIFKNDLGEPVLRATRLGGFTLFTHDRPTGEAVSLAGACAPLRLPTLSPQAVFDRLTQATLRSSRAARHLVAFDAEGSPGSSALIADAATIATIAIIHLAQRRDGAALLARLHSVRLEEGRKPQASLKDGVLRIVVAPAQGLAGRPSSQRIVRAASGR
jgi:hypothetical protein